MPISTKLRHEVFRRDLWTCQYCGRKAPDVILYVDHEIPRARGGKDVRHNLVTSCEACNLGKSDRPIFRSSTGLPLNARESAAFLLGLLVGTDDAHTGTDGYQRRADLAFDGVRLLGRNPERIDEDRLRVQASRLLYLWSICNRQEDHGAAHVRAYLQRKASEAHLVVFPSDAQTVSA